MPILLSNSSTMTPYSSPALPPCGVAPPLLLPADIRRSRSSSEGFFAAVDDFCGRVLVAVAVVDSRSRPSMRSISLCAEPSSAGSAPPGVVVAALLEAMGLIVADTTAQSALSEDAQDTS